MSQEIINEARREHKILNELENLCGGEGNQDLYKDMDELCDDLEYGDKSEFFRKQDDIDNDSFGETPANTEELPVNTEPSQEQNDIVMESDAQTSNIEKLESCDNRQSDKGIVAKHWLLFVGLVLVAIGMFGVIGLRLNLVQIYLLGIVDPFPGIGSAEPMGHIASIIPFAIGIVAIYAWGFSTYKGEELEDTVERNERVEKESHAVLGLL